MKMTAFWDIERYSLVVVLKKARATSERRTYLWNVGLLRDLSQKSVVFIIAAVRTWNVTSKMLQTKVATYWCS